MKKIKIMVAAGARPNFMKVAPVIGELKKKEKFDVIFAHTGQHYDADMSEIFIKQLGLPRPDIRLNVGSGSHARQTARVMTGMEEALLRVRPSAIVVVGDVNSTMAAALAAVKLRVPVAHVEAGLRSRDRDMPEEINRIVTDAVSDYLFVTCEDGRVNLLKEGVPDGKIFFVGNVMIDTLGRLLPTARSLDTLKKNNLAQRNYALMTLHRPSNVDDKNKLAGIIRALDNLPGDFPVIFPAHPRTAKHLRRFRLGGNVSGSRVKIVPPTGYLEFLNLMDKALFVLTDSGGIQEETTYLKIPCLTIRNNTERPVTIREGSNTLTGTDTGKILEKVREILAGKYKKGKIPRFWDGKASSRIARILADKLCAA